jgi:hypothetical protein
MSESQWWYLFHKEVKSCDSTTLVLDLTISKPGLKAVSSNASLGWRVRFFGRDDPGFLKEEVRTYPMAPMSPINSPTFFCFHDYSLCYVKMFVQDKLTVSSKKIATCIFGYIGERNRKDTRETRKQQRLVGEMLVEGHCWLVTMKSRAASRDEGSGLLDSEKPSALSISERDKDGTG